MPDVVIRCPRTGSNVQVWVSEGTSVPNTDEYEGVTCLACMQVHFVHKISGKLLGQQVAGKGLILPSASPDMLDGPMATPKPRTGENEG